MGACQCDVWRSVVGAAKWRGTGAQYDSDSASGWTVDGSACANGTCVNGTSTTGTDCASTSGASTNGTRTNGACHGRVHRQH